MKRALFIDRDGTINRDCPYCHDPADISIYDDAVDLMRRYRSDGYMIMVVTNQSGINRNYFSVDQMNIFNDALNSKLRSLGAEYDLLYYCPHTPEEKCNCRKPGTGMVERACAENEIDLKGSVMAGDRDDIDGELARKLGIPFIHFMRV